MNNTLTAINFKRNDLIIWSLKGSFGESFILGSLLAGNQALFIMDNYQYTFTISEKNREIDSLNIINNSKYAEYSIKDNSDIPPKSITHTCGIIGKNPLADYYIWLRVFDDIILYRFEDIYFLQGLITMIRGFRLNYRDIMIACPIRVYRQGTIFRVQYYQIKDYPLPYLPMNDGDSLIERGPPLEVSYNLCSLELNPYFIESNIPNEPNKINEANKEMVVRLMLLRNYLNSKASLKADVDDVLKELKDVIIQFPSLLDYRVADAYIKFRGFDAVGYNRSNPLRMQRAFIQQYKKILL